MPRLPLVELPEDLPVANNLVRAMYHNPDLYRAFGRLAMQVHVSSHLDERVRELVVLAVAGHLDAPYQWSQHVVAAGGVGIDAQEIAAIERRDLDRFTGAEGAAVRFALAVEDRTMTDDLWAQTARYFDEAALLDLTMLAIFYGLASRFTLAADVPLDA
jgi:4-carboxymuconolactone decarboxylase